MEGWQALDASGVISAADIFRTYLDREKLLVLVTVAFSRTSLKVKFRHEVGPCGSGARHFIPYPARQFKVRITGAGGHHIYVDHRVVWQMAARRGLCVPRVPQRVRTPFQSAAAPSDNPDLDTLVLVRQAPNGRRHAAHDGSGPRLADGRECRPVAFSLSLVAPLDGEARVGPGRSPADVEPAVADAPRGLNRRLRHDRHRDGVQLRAAIQ